MTRHRAPAAEAGVLDPSSLFRCLKGRNGLVLAVSGGADSTALMLLAARWSERPPVMVVTVDHGLRAEAAAEAALVKANATKLGLSSRIVTAGAREGGNLQDWARRERYRCLAEVAREARFDTIVTAHHQDDQAETFLLRLARGSGVYGLAAMRTKEKLDGLLLARPLLGVPRAALAAISAGSGLETVADPSNADLRFDRVRMRALMPTLADHGLGPVRLAATAARLGRAAEALDHYTGEFLRMHFQVNSFGVVSGAADAFGTVPEEVGLRALAHILRAVAGADYTPPLTSVEALHAAVTPDEGAADFRLTLAGAVVAVAGGKLTADREWGREGIAHEAVVPGQRLIWDGRFRMQVPRIAGSLSVGPLGSSERRFTATGGMAATLRTLPGLYSDGALIAAPVEVRARGEGDRLDILDAECIVGQRLGVSATGRSG